MKVRYALTNFSLIADYITPRKQYLVTRWNSDGTFKIQDDEGEEILCTMADDHHLYGAYWEIQVLSCEVNDNVIQLPQMTGVITTPLEVDLKVLEKWEGYFDELFEEDE